MSTIHDYAHLKDTLASITLGYGMKLGSEELEGRGYFIYVYAENDPCHDTGKPISWKGRKWYVSKHATGSELVLTAFKAFLTALEHEAREDFKFQGIRVLDPHVSVFGLAHLIDTGELQQDARLAEPPPPAPDLEPWTPRFLFPSWPFFAWSR